MSNRGIESEIPEPAEPMDGIGHPSRFFKLKEVMPRQRICRARLAHDVPIVITEEKANPHGEIFWHEGLGFLCEECRKEINPGPCRKYGAERQPTNADAPY